jgi:hypothetical protein
MRIHIRNTASTVLVVSTFFRQEQQCIEDHSILEQTDEQLFGFVATEVTNKNTSKASNQLSIFL